MDQGSTPSSTHSLPSFKDLSSEGSQRQISDQATAQIQLSGLNQIYYLQADENYQDNDGSKTTYESCSSNSNTSENDDMQLQQLIHIAIRPQCVKKFQWFKHNSRLQNLKEGKIIQFEEYEPFNNSNRNDQILTGGRLTSQASNSNKYSLSKTFNFQMAFICQNDDQSSGSIPDSSRINEANQEQDQYHNDLTQRVDEKIRMIAEEYNQLAQTQGSKELLKYQLLQSDQYQEACQSERQEDPFFKHAVKRNQSHESTQQPFLKTNNYNNTLISDQENNDFYAALSHKRNSLINKQRLQDRMSSAHNRTLNGTQQIKDLTFSKNYAGSFIQSSQNTVVRGVTQTIDTHSDSKKTANKHERKFSESSSYKNQSNSQQLNAMNSQSFNRTVAFGQGSINLNSKKLEDQVSELRYMLENVQCEAKNLKLLLNLKDDQLQMYETKNQELINENEDFSYKDLETKQKIEAVEEENLYLKAIINSHNIPARKSTKINASINTDTIMTQSQSCQATFPQVKVVKHSTTSVGTSPCKQKIEQYEHLEQNYDDLLLRYSEQEKENINFINQFNEQADRIKQLEGENLKLNTQQNHQAKESQEIKKSMQNENKSLYWQLESSKQQILDREQKIREIMQVFEDTKIHDKKKSAKIKSLKKERDQLRIEILKLKQIYSEKCDGYKDSKIKLTKKLKKRDEVIQKLQEQVISIESYYRNLYQQSTRIQYHNGKDSTPQNYPPATTGKFPQDLDHSGALHLRSSVSSRSLENTRNLNSTAKGAIRGLNQILNKNEGSKEQSQNVRDIIQATNTHNTSLSNPPKSKNLTPGSLPSGTGGHALHFSNQIEDYQRDKMMAKLKSQYRKLDIEEEKVQYQALRKAQVNQKPKQQMQQQNHLNHYISNDKSKSFYSSDIENNTLFDQNHIVMEDQSNSSNFFSNVNNSNSHLFLDDSSVVGKNTEINYVYQTKQNDQEKYRQMMKNESHSQLKAFTDQQLNHNIPKATQNPQLMYSNNNQQKHSKQPTVKQSKLQPPQINHSQMQSLQQDDHQAYVNNQRLNHYTKFLHNPTSATHSKSPISKNNEKAKTTTTTTDHNINIIQRNRSSQNLSQGDQANNTQNSIRQNRNDSATSSNRNLHQVKDQIRPPSTSSTNNTSAVYHNQVAMISYHSSSSGGSKQYQTKMAKLNKQQIQAPMMNNYVPYYSNQQPLQSQQQVQQQNLQQQQQYPPNYQSINYQKYYQVQQQVPQVNVGYQSTIQNQVQVEEKMQHRRQRSKQYDNDNIIQDEAKFQPSTQNIYDINTGSRANNTKNYYQHGFN